MKKHKLISILIIAALGRQNAAFTHGDDFKCLRPRAMEERDSDKVAKDFEIAKKKVKLLTLMNAQGIKSMLELSRRSGIDRGVIKDIVEGAVTPDENVITCLANVLKVKLNELRLGLGLWKPEPANVPPHLSEDKGPSPDRIFAVGIDKDILLALIGLLEIQPDIYFDQSLPAQRLYQAIRSKIGISPDKCSDIELGARLQRMLGEAISFEILPTPNRDISYVVIDAGHFMKVAVKKLHPQGAIPQSAALQDAARREPHSFILRPVAAGEKKDNKEAVKEYERLEKFIATHGFEYGSLSDGSVHLHTPYPLIYTIFNELKIVRGDLHKLHYLAVGAGDLSDSLVAASEEYSMKVTAVEKEPIVHQKARAILKEAKKKGLISDDNLVLLPSQDVFNMSWQGIDIAYFFYTEPADQADVKAMREKIHLRVREMNSNGILAVLFIGAQLFHNWQEIPGLIKIEPGPLWISDAMTGLYLYLYRAGPSNIAPQGVIPQDAAVKRLHSSILRPVAAGERRHDIVDEELTALVRNGVAKKNLEIIKADSNLRAVYEAAIHFLRQRAEGIEKVLRRVIQPDGKYIEEFMGELLHAKIMEDNIQHSRVVVFSEQRYGPEIDFVLEVNSSGNPAKISAHTILEDGIYLVESKTEEEGRVGFILGNTIGQKFQGYKRNAAAMERERKGVKIKGVIFATGGKAVRAAGIEAFWLRKPRVTRDEKDEGLSIFLAFIPDSVMREEPQKKIGKGLQEDVNIRFAEGLISDLINDKKITEEQREEYKEILARAAGIMHVSAVRFWIMGQLKAQGVDPLRRATQRPEHWAKIFENLKKLTDVNPKPSSVHVDGRSEEYALRNILRPRAAGERDMKGDQDIGISGYQE